MSDLHERAGESFGPDPRDPRPEDVRVLHVAEGESAVPRAFSADVIVFDHEPADEELVALLGRRHSFDLRRLDTADGFKVRRPRLPVRWIAAWMALVALVASGLILASRSDPLPVRFLFCLLFSAGAALMVLCFWGLEVHSRRQPDALRVDLRRRVLEAPGSALRVPIDEVIACVRLKRWFYRASGTEQGASGGDIRQLGVLVPAGADLPGRIAYHPLAQELVIAHGGNQIIDGVLEELGRPVRRINLTLDKVLGAGAGLLTLRADGRLAPQVAHRPRRCRSSAERRKRGAAAGCVAGSRSCARLGFHTHGVSEPPVSG